MSSVSEKVIKIIVDELGTDIEQVTPDKRFIEDLGADSLDLVELIMAFETEFHQEIPDEEAETLKTVGDAINYIEKKMAEAAPAEETKAE